MHLGPKISGVEFVFLPTWRREYSIKYTLVYWRNKVQISWHGFFDLCTSGIHQRLMFAYT